MESTKMTASSESKVIVSPSSTAFVGPAATELFRAQVLLSALGLLQAGISPTRGLTRTRALVMASRYTAKSYKRTQIAQARLDLRVWIESQADAVHMEFKS
jgi:hypothetical protein